MWWRTAGVLIDSIPIQMRQAVTPTAPDDPWTPAARAAVARWKPVASVKNRVMARCVAGTSRLWMTRANALVVHDGERLRDARSIGGGLLTFSNHVSLFDDPLLTSCLSGSEWSRIRWIAADALNFFGSPLRAAIFNAGKCVPVVRGAGVDQPGMAFLSERLRDGDWVHIFPEGGRTRSERGLLQTPLKTGLAVLVRASRPLLLPFYHQGMREVLPISSALPRMGRTVTLRFGTCVDSSEGLAEATLEEITQWATDQLLALQAASP